MESNNCNAASALLPQPPEGAIRAVKITSSNLRLTCNFIARPSLLRLTLLQRHIQWGSAESETAV